MSKPDDFNETVIKWMLGACFVGLLIVAIPNFIRARSTSARNACINNLRQIEGAKQQWALENNKQTNDVPARDDVALYLKNNMLPVCPSGGKYILGRVNEDPRCSIGGPGHTLPTP